MLQVILRFGGVFGFGMLSILLLSDMIKSLGTKIPEDILIHPSASAGIACVVCG